MGAGAENSQIFSLVKKSMYSEIIWPLEVMKRVEYKYASRDLKIKGYQQIQLEYLQGNKLVQGLPRLNFQVPAEGLKQVILLKNTVLDFGVP